MVNLGVFYVHLWDIWFNKYYLDELQPFLSGIEHIVEEYKIRCRMTLQYTNFCWL